MADARVLIFHDKLVTISIPIICALLIEVQVEASAGGQYPGRSSIAGKRTRLRNSHRTKARSTYF